MKEGTIPLQKSRMEDAVDPDDVSIYRAIAGGVTSIQLLHGSANPIGGRSAILKLKWGENAEDLIYDNSPKYIKFALGENVKQSNWGGNSRFPQSRMGVEQVFRDYFSRAKAYGEKKPQVSLTDTMMKWKLYLKLSMESDLSVAILMFKVKSIC